MRPAPIRRVRARLPERRPGEPRGHWATRSVRILVSERRGPDPLASRGRSTEVDVVVPVGPLDLELAGPCLDGVERYSRNAVRRIWLVTPGSLAAELRRAVGSRAEIVADEELLDDDVRSALTTRFSGRAGWLAQQLVKLSAPELSDAEAFLVVDADTVLVRPRLFRSGGRVLLLTSREFHVPYYAALARLWGRRPRLPPFSCVAHHMCFLAGDLIVLRQELERRTGDEWRRAIVAAVGPDSAFSEYELYGEWRLRERRRTSVVRAAHNMPLPRSEIESFDELAARVPAHVHSVSCHSWLEG